MNDEFYKYSCSEALEKLNSSEIGLSSKEAIKRQREYGLNLLPVKKEKSVIVMFLSGLKDRIVMVLLVAALLSFLAGEKIDAIAILFIILLDLALGTYEEYKANKSAKALQSLIKPNAKVLRDGKETIINSKELVVGDIITLTSGDKLSADGRIINCQNLTVDESVLTGESISVEKNASLINKKSTLSERTNMVFAATTVTTGRALVLVTSTGVNTEVGKIAHQVNNTEDEKSPLTIRTEKFSSQISIGIVIISIIIAFVLKQKGLEGTEIFLSVIALAVSAMPEGLPLALTMALTIASNKMLSKRVIVKRLNAVESLGSCTVIASDKTGTLTVNEQTAKKIILPNDEIFEVSGSGYNDKGRISSPTDYDLKNIDLLIESTSLNNEASLEKEDGKWKPLGDSIDVAFLSLGMKHNIDLSNIVKKESILYESEKKYSAVYYEKDSDLYCSAKGSVEVILDFCNNMIIDGKRKKLDKNKILNQNNMLAKEGYRVIAVANKKISKNYNKDKIENLDFLGLVAFIDPIRTSTIKSISKCRKAGIKVVMITGDHPLTAFSIAKSLKIADYENDVATSEEIDKYYAKSEIEFDNFVRNKTVFSRVTPIQKFNIVESFKRQGEFIAVTGDGVNDAPALKSANIGVAMGSGTDVAKDTADMILMDDDFKDLVAGIEEGRVAYSNIRKICYLLLSCGVSEVLFFLLSIILGLPIPLVAIQLLWINLVTDGLQDLALSFDKKEDNLMDEGPRNPNESLFNKDLILEVLISGIFIGVLVFSVWYYLINIVQMDTYTARGYILILMVFIQNMHVLNCRSEKSSILKTSIKTNPFVIFSILGSIALQIIFMEIPVLSKFLQTKSIALISVLSMLILSMCIILVMELYKVIRFYKNDKEK